MKLRSDPNIFQLDPSLPPLPSSNDLIDLREPYSSFLSTLSKDLVQSEMVQEEGGVEVLDETGKEVVSEREDSFSEEEFWKRCLFRVSLIEEEEEKRKKVLNVAQSEEEDFTEDLDGDESLASASQATSPTPTYSFFPPFTSLLPTSTSTTPTPLPSTQPYIPSTTSETPSSFARLKFLITPTSSLNQLFSSSSRQTKGDQFWRVERVGEIERVMILSERGAGILALIGRREWRQRRSSQEVKEKRERMRRRRRRRRIVLGSSESRSRFGAIISFFDQPLSNIKLDLSPLYLRC